MRTVADRRRTLTQLDELALEINDEKMIKTEHTASLDYLELGEMIEPDE